MTDADRGVACDIAIDDVPHALFFDQRTLEFGTGPDLVRGEPRLGRVFEHFVRIGRAAEGAAWPERIGECGKTDGACGQHGRRGFARGLAWLHAEDLAGRAPGAGQIVALLLFDPAFAFAPRGGETPVRFGHAVRRQTVERHVEIL
jgi:hypothetical protein